MIGTIQHERNEDMEEQHLYHHNDQDLRVSMKIEKNSKGYNWECSVSGAKTVEEAIALLTQGENELKKVYGNA